MTQESTTASKQNSRPFLVRLLIAFFKLVFWAALIGGIVGGGMFLLQEIQTLQAANLKQEGQMDLLRSDMENYVLAKQYDARVPLIEQKLETLTGDLDTADEDLDDLADELETQAAALDELSTQTAGTSTNLAEVAATVETLSVTFDELQGTVDDTGSDLSAVDAAIGALNSQAAGIAEELETLQTEAATDTATLVTLRVWSLVMRARLSLAENDARGAQADIKQAQTAVNALIEAGPEDLTEQMTAVKELLDEAAGDVLSDSDAASDSLDDAWVALDETMSNLLGYAELEAEIAGQEDEDAAADEPADEDEEEEDDEEEESDG